MTLNPISTAPRDGSDVWCMSKSGISLHKVAWDDCGDSACWAEDGRHAYDDNCFSGWLDIEALARDSERLDYLEREMEIEQRLIKHTDQRVNSLFRRNMPITRAAIDKEMERG